MALDAPTAGRALAGPGMDTRQWVSYGTVQPDSPESPSVTFDDELGPLVNVILQPSGAPVVCRVAMRTAGNGEAEYDPFVEGDEVKVLVTNGDERAGCSIVGRFNNRLDPFPKTVAGIDVTKNQIAFRRNRAPYVHEVEKTWLVRSATTKALLLLDAKGGWSMTCGDGHYLAANADFLSMQTADGAYVAQLDLVNKRVLLQADGTVLELLADGDTKLLTTGRTLIGTSGGQPLGHAIAVEQAIILLKALFTALGAAIAGPWTGVGVAGAFDAAMNVALAATTVLPIAPYKTALTTALAAPPDATGAKPGVAVAGLLVG